MRVRLLTLRFDNALGTFDDRPLDALLAGRELIDLREHFFLAGGVAHLVCIVQYRDPAASGRSAGAGPPREATRSARPIRARDAARDERSGRDRPDPLEGLDDVQRALFQTLREWRSDTAQREGVPPYVVLTNRELVGVIRGRPRSRSALAQVPGIGKGKLERYGEALLARLADALANGRSHLAEVSAASASEMTPEVHS